MALLPTIPLLALPPTPITINPPLPIPSTLLLMRLVLLSLMALLIPDTCLIWVQIAPWIGLTNDIMLFTVAATAASSTAGLLHGL